MSLKKLKNKRGDFIVIKYSCIILISYILCSCSYKNNKLEYETGMEWGAKVNYYISEVNQDDDEFYTIQVLNKDDDFDTLATFLPNKYVICIDILGNKKLIYEDNYKVSFRGEVYKNDVKKFLVKIYDIGTNREIKEVNVKKIIDENEDIQVQGFLSIVEAEIYNEVPYLTVRIERNPNTLKNDEKNKDMVLYINLEDDSYFYRDFVNKYNKVVCIEREDVLRGCLLAQNISKARLRIYSSDYEGKIAVYLNLYKLPQDNKVLYTKFPKLKGYVEELAKTKKRAEIEFMLSDKMTDEEVLRLFIQDGKDISFDGVIINAKDSVDGLPHKVNNFDDFYKYMEPKEHLRPDSKAIIDN